ncbi:MAG: hypothetical protein K2P84_11415 [Undibacterium sp.]|nr:hypothetical protein [Undibacterium sp.]
MKADTSSSDSLATLLLVPAGALAIYGLIDNLLLPGGAFLVAGVALMRYRRHRLLGIVAAVFGIVFSSVVFSYGIGKDMALRDNALSKPKASAQSASPNLSLQQTAFGVRSPSR